MGIHGCIFTLLLVIANLSSVHTQAISRVWSCNFEGNSSCGAILQAVGQNVKFDFMRGPTPSDQTGPLYDNTLKGPGGTYIYLEATDREEGNQAIMDSPKLDAVGEPRCLEFYYHMFSGSGDHQGTLRVETKPGDDIIFNVSGSQGLDWILVRRDLDRNVEQVVFRAIRGVRYQSDIALDDIFITTGGCKVEGPPQPGQGSPPGGQNPNEAGPDRRPTPATPRPDTNTPRPNTNTPRPDINVPRPDRPGAEQPSERPSERPIERPIEGPIEGPSERPGGDPPREGPSEERPGGDPPREGPSEERPGGDPPREGPSRDPPGPARPGTPPPRGEQVPGTAPPFQADFPEIPDQGQRPDALPPGQTGPPALPLNPRAQSFMVRLMDGRDQYQGRLEIFINGSWGTVCSDGWTQLESFAACRSLNLSAGEMGRAPETARLLSSDRTPIWLDGVRCSPGSRLNGCCHNEVGVHDCDHSKDVYLNCGTAIQGTNEAPSCRPGSTDCRPPPCNPQLQICLPQPPRVPDPPGQIPPQTPPPRQVTPTIPDSQPMGEAARPTLSPRQQSPPQPPPLPAGRISNKSDFDRGSPDFNGLNFTNDGNFKHRFLVVEEVKTNGPTPEKFWMELYSQNGGAYARLKSRPVSLGFDGIGCLGYRILTSTATQWSITIGNRLGRQMVEIGADKARAVPEALLSPIEASRVTAEPFNIYAEAWVDSRNDLFSIDDITIYNGTCPSA